MSTLEELGIALRHRKPGEHRAPCPECDRGPRDDALAVRLEGDGSATWICHRCGFKGGIGGERDLSRRRDNRNVKPEPQPVEPAQPLSPRPIVGALKVWDEAGTIGLTPAEAYLRRRGLITSAGTASPYPWDHLRFHRNCIMGDAAYPALIVAINDPTGLLVAVQRIALTEDGRKAPISSPKMSLGPVKGGAARLADWRITDTLAVTEGVEDALAYMQLTATPTLAACGAGMIKSMVLPKSITNVVIVADADDAGMKAASEAYDAFTSQGRCVRVVRPIGAKDPAELAERVA
jgi:hypothetical protein